MKKIMTLMITICFVFTLCAGAMAAVPSSSAVVDTAVGFAANDDGTQASQHTDVWMKVAAAGNIDVTVPLTIVFSTSLSGGVATVPVAYKLVNNSSFDLKVTKVKIANPSTGTNKIAIVENTGTDGETIADLSAGTNQMALLFKPTNGKVLNIDSAAVADINSTGKVFDIAAADFKLAANKGENIIDLKLSTSPLSFVTEEGDKGVKVLTFSYVVAIDAGTPVGESISSTADTVFVP